MVNGLFYYLGGMKLPAERGQQIHIIYLYPNRMTDPRRGERERGDTVHAIDA